MIFDTNKLIKLLGLGLLAWLSGSMLMAARADTRLRTYQVDGKAVDFLDLGERRLLISRSCQKPGGREGELDCDAYAVIRRKDPPPEIRFRGGENPGALLCHGLRGQVVWGLDEGRNQTTFCRFKDNSMVSSGSLTYWLLLDEKK